MYGEDGQETGRGDVLDLENGEYFGRAQKGSAASGD